MTSDRLGLVADIGRRSVRFAISGGVQGVAPRNVRAYEIERFATFTAALMEYLGEVGLTEQPMASMIAVAGIARGDNIGITGSRWFISLPGVASVLRAPCRAINDFAAAAFALTALPTGAFETLPGASFRPIAPGGNYLVVGPGTGLGVAGLVTTPGGRLMPVQSEAGHMTLCPATPAERLFAEKAGLRAGEPLSVEALVSAGGLCAAYRAVGGSGPDRAEDITRGASRDPAARQAVDLLVGALGAFVGDLVMAFGAWDGVFLTGPMVRALRGTLATPAFRSRVEAKGAYARHLRGVPISIVDRSQLELLGAAAILDTA